MRAWGAFNAGELRFATVARSKAEAIGRFWSSSPLEWRPMAEATELRALRKLGKKVLRYVDGIGSTANNHLALREAAEEYRAAMKRRRKP